MWPKPSLRWVGMQSEDSGGADWDKPNGKKQMHCHKKILIKPKLLTFTVVCSTLFCLVHNSLFVPS